MAELNNSELRQKLKAFGEDIGPITPSTRNIYLKKLKSLQQNNNKSFKSVQKPVGTPPRIHDRERVSNVDYFSQKYQTNTNVNHQNELSNGSRSIYSHQTTQSSDSNWRPDQFLKLSPEYSSSSIESDLQSIVNDNSRKNFVSPIAYSSKQPSRFHSRFGGPGNSTVTINSNGNTANNNSNNNLKRWYRGGSFNTISSYFTSRDGRDDLMDISDADLSDNESDGLMARLRRGYYKTSGSVESETSKSKLKHEKKSETSFINWNQLPNILILAFVLFSIILLASYLLIKQNYSHMELDSAINGLVCQDGRENCFTKEQIPLLKYYLSILYDILAEYSGQKTCEYISNKKIAFSRAKELLNNRLKLAHKATINDEQWSDLMKLMMNLPVDKLNIMGFDNSFKVLSKDDLPERVTYLEGLKPKRSLMCRLTMFTMYILSWITYIFLFSLLLVVFIVIGYFINLYRLRKKESHERHISELKEIVNSISGLLQDQIRQSEYSVTTDKFLSLSKIRMILQQSYPKLRDNNFWEQVKQFMYTTEPLIELKETIAHGEILQWKCHPGWQGSAVQSDCEVRFDKGPTECLKIRNMDVQKFDENGQNYLRREVMNRIKDAGEVRDIRFLTKGPKVIVYVMCASREVAGKAFRKINANYFNGNLLNVKFIRLDKYLERFPDSKVYIK